MVCARATNWQAVLCQAGRRRQCLRTVVMLPTISPQGAARPGALVRMHGYPGAAPSPLGQAQPDQLRASQRRSRMVVAAAMLDDEARAAFLPPTRAMG